MKKILMVLLLGSCLSALYAGENAGAMPSSDEALVKVPALEDKPAGGAVERADLATDKVVEMSQAPAEVVEKVTVEQEEIKAVPEPATKQAKEVVDVAQDVVAEEVQEEEPKPLTKEEQEQFLKDLGLDVDEGEPAPTEE